VTSSLVQVASGLWAALSSLDIGFLSCKTWRLDTSVALKLLKVLDLFCPTTSHMEKPCMLG
jgi:hypothetical protein